MTGYRRLRIVLFPALLGASQLFLFGPFTIYASNRGEFSVTVWSLIGYWLVPLLVLATALVVVAYVGSDRLFRVYVAALFGLGLLLWVQGNLLVADYGLLDGREIDWSEQAWRSPYEIALWIGLPALAVVMARRVATVAPFASQVLLALQTALLILTGVGSEGELRDREWQIPTELVYEFSRDQNVIHLVLDGFQSDVFHEILDEDRETFDRAFEGFVFFANHGGAFPTTMASMPAMVTGAVYRNEMPVGSFVAERLRRQSIFSGLARHDYETDVISINDRYVPRADITNWYFVPLPFVSYRDHKRYVAAQLVDISLFRHLPHLLKPRVYNQQEWLLQKIFSMSKRGYLSSSGIAFIQQFIPRMKTARDGPLLKFIHLGMPHFPVVLDADCGFIGVVRGTRGAYERQAQCAVSMITAFLDRLRDLGIYDDSLIILSSDHGVYFPPRGFSWGDTKVTGTPTVAGSRLSDIAGSAMALLVIKPPGSSAPLVISEAPTTISDIPATLFDILGLPNAFPGEPAFRLDANATRPRTYAYYHWSNPDWGRSYFRALHLFSIEGSLRDGAAWSFGETIFGPELDLEVETIDLGTPSARLHMGLGWSTNEKEGDGTPVVWALGEIATVYTSLARDRATELVARLMSPPFNHPQVIEVAVDGRAVGRWTPSGEAGYRDYSLRIPPDAERPRISTIAFRFSQYQVDEGRAVAVKFDKISLKPE